MCVIAVARAVEALNDRRGRFFSVKLEERLVRDSRGASSMSTQSVICCRPCRGYGLIDHAGGVLLWIDQVSIHLISLA
jgi:hypothetical protein